VPWGYSMSSRAKDRAEDIKYRREAAAFLAQAHELVERAKKKMVGVKGLNVNQELFSILHELKETAYSLKDPHNDPE
jgi:hypothetical protein